MWAEWLDDFIAIVTAEARRGTLQGHVGSAYQNDNSLVKANISMKVRASTVSPVVKSLM